MVTKQLAYDSFFNFMKREYRGILTSAGWLHLKHNKFCPNCKNKKRSALYILISEGAPIILNCFRAGCEHKYRVLRDKSSFYMLGYEDDDVIDVLIKEGSKGYTKTIKTGQFQFFIRDFMLNDSQKDYLYKRTKLLMDIDLVKKYRIIPNLEQVILDNYEKDVSETFLNNLKRTKYNPNDVTFACDNYNTFFIRGIPKTNSTYVKKTILTLQSQVNTGYTLRRGSKKHIDTIFITEGIFDIINIFNMNKDVDNAIFIAALGFDKISNLISYYCTEFAGQIKRLVVFADSDEVTELGSYVYKKSHYEGKYGLFTSLKRKLGDVFEEIILVYNRKSKDFGDLSEPIDPVMVKIK